MNRHEPRKLIEGPDLGPVIRFSSSFQLSRIFLLLLTRNKESVYSTCIQSINKLWYVV
jgi:hypothetical protein